MIFRLKFRFRQKSAFDGVGGKDGKMDFPALLCKVVHVVHSVHFVHLCPLKTLFRSFQFPYFS